MTTIVQTGARVVPGDVLYSVPVSSATGSHITTKTTTTTAASAEASNDALPEPRVHAGEGCYTRLSAARATPQTASVSHGVSGPDMELSVLSSRMGVVQWDGACISVYPVPSATASHASQPAWAAHNTLSAGRQGSAGGVKTEESAQSNTEQQQQQQHPSHSEQESNKKAAGVSGVTANVFGPRPGDTVHVRITRVARLFAYGEIIAINGTWCCHGRSAGHGGGSSAAMPSGAFRGVLRVEDIRPFRPSKEQLQPPAPSLAFQPGDVVVAEVISQSDVRQYQLSTLGETCGVVEAYATYGTRRVALEHLPRRRDAMLSPLDKAVIPRWCPYLAA